VSNTQGPADRHTCRQPLCNSNSVVALTSRCASCIALTADVNRRKTADLLVRWLGSRPSTRSHASHRFPTTRLSDVSAPSPCCSCCTTAVAADVTAVAWSLSSLSSVAPAPPVRMRSRSWLVPATPSLFVGVQGSYLSGHVGVSTTPAPTAASVKAELVLPPLLLVRTA
jgi:hypothetical protein